MRKFLLVFFLFCGAWAQSGDVPVKEDSSALVKKTEETVFLNENGRVDSSVGENEDFYQKPYKSNRARNNFGSGFLIAIGGASVVVGAIIVMQGRGEGLESLDDAFGGITIGLLGLLSMIWGFSTIDLGASNFPQENSVSTHLLISPTVNVEGNAGMNLLLLF